MSEFFQFPEVLVVEASAGSGKTYTLAKRYVQLALYLVKLQKIPIQSILAITFTNKATWEMKSRILDFLKRIALKQLKPYEVQDILLPLGLDEEKSSILAFALMEDVIHQYHYFQVQTIDSFIRALLKGCSFKIGLSAQFKTQNNFRDYLQLALDELLESAHTNKEIHKLFENFIRQYLFLENRGSWFPKDNLLNVMVALFEQYNNYEKSLIAYPSGEDLFTKKKKIYDLIQQLQPLCPSQTNKHFLNHIKNFLESNEGVFDVDHLKTYWSKEEFPLNKGGVLSPEVEKLWEQLRKEICDLCWLESHTIFNAYIGLFDSLLSCFYQLSHRDDVLFLKELSRKAALLFSDELVTVEELYFRLSARLQHYLIDEFQDTSLIQWRNLASMVEEALSTRGSLFYVGDKKQAIYSFRGGESRLFDALQRQFIDYVKLQHLDKNYRSFPKIIEFNNSIFNEENLKAFLQRKYEDECEHKRNGVYFKDDDLKEMMNVFGHAKQTPGKDLNGGLVRVTHLMGQTKPEYTSDAKDKLISLVQEIRHRFDLRDIAILTRGNNEVEDIAQWLWHEGIPAQSERNSDIKNNSLVTEIIAFLTFLNSPIDNNAFAQFCLGALLPKATGVSAERFREFLFESARQKDNSSELFFYRQFREVFPKIWNDLFEPFVRQAGVYPLYELTAGIIARFNCERHFPQYQGFVIHLLQLIKMREEQSCDLSAFLDYYETLEEQERFVPMAQAEAVNILTVHKAKGLEFSVVIIPFLEMDVKVGSGGRDGAQSYVLDITEKGMGLVRLKESYRTFCPSLQAQYEAEYKRAFLLELNTVYVALTRAIEELYVFIPERSGSSVNNVRFLIPEESFDLGESSKRPHTPRIIEKRHKITSFVDQEWLPKLREEFLSDQTVSIAAAREGEIVHEFLSKIGNLTETNFPQEEKIRHVIEARHLKKFFYLPSGAEVFCEKEFVNSFGDTRRIDRLIVFPDQVWVIDYKTSRLGQDQHKIQMQGYIDLLKSFYPGKKIEGSIIFLDDLTAETV